LEIGYQLILLDQESFLVFCLGLILSCFITIFVHVFI
jgi:hypothetical protein